MVAVVAGATVAEAGAAAADVEAAANCRGRRARRPALLALTKWFDRAHIYLDDC